MKKYENRIVIITRETRLSQVLEAQNTVSQARFYINQLGADFDEYEAEHTRYKDAVREARRNLEELSNVQVLERKFLPNFIFAPSDIIVVIGQDGLVVNTLKYLNTQAVIGVNPDPSRWDGVLLPFTPADAAKIVEETITGKRKFRDVTMAKVRVQNGQELLAVNDFFIGQKTHASARYVIKYGGYKEPQSSSGVIVSTGLGSTGWMKSVIAGASRISTSVIGKPYGGKQESEALTEIDEEEYAVAAASTEESFMEEELEAKAMRRMRYPKRSKKLRDYLNDEPVKVMALRVSSPLAAASVPRVSKKQVYGATELSGVVGKWSSEELMFAVREPFPSKSTGTNLVFGKISAREPLKIESLMGENGVIFSDGIESDFISFNSGCEAVITIAGRKGHIVV
jgi:NAD kinase